LRQRKDAGAADGGADANNGVKTSGAAARSGTVGVVDGGGGGDGAAAQVDTKRRRRQRRRQACDDWGVREWGILLVLIALAVWGALEYAAATYPFVAWVMGRPEPVEDETPNTEGATLWVAASLGNVTALQAAAAAGGDVEWRHPEHGTTPLMAACVFDRLHSAKALYAAGANARARDEGSQEWSVLQLATHNAARNCVTWLLEETEAINDLNARDKLGCTPLHNAAFRNEVVVGRILVEHGADLHTRDLNGGLALHWAAYAGSDAAMEWLLDETEAAQDIGARNKRGRTPMHIAASGTTEGHLRTVQALLARGADARATDKRKNTVLHDAAAYSSRENVEWLLTHSPARHDIQATNKFGESPADRADEEKNEATANVLRTFASLGLAVHEAVAAGDAARVRELGEIDAPLRWRDDAGVTPLERAADAGDESVIRALEAAMAREDE